ANAFGFELFYRRPSVGSRRHLHHDIGMPLGKAPALLYHSCGLQAYSFRADGPIDYAGNLTDDLFVALTMGFANQCGIGSHAGEDSPAGRLTYLIDISGVKKNAHCLCPT